MNPCESYWTKTYSKISGASSCRYIGIAGCLRYNQGKLYPIFKTNFGYSVKSGGEGALGFCMNLGFGSQLSSSSSSPAFVSFRFVASLPSPLLHLCDRSNHTDDDSHVTWISNAMKTKQLCVRIAKQDKSQSLFPRRRCERREDQGISVKKKVDLTDFVTSCLSVWLWIVARNHKKPLTRFARLRGSRNAHETKSAWSLMCQEEYWFQVWFVGKGWKPFVQKKWKRMHQLWGAV